MGSGVRRPASELAGYVNEACSEQSGVISANLELALLERGTPRVARGFEPPGKVNTGRALRMGSGGHRPASELAGYVNEACSKQAGGPQPTLSWLCLSAVRRACCPRL